MVLIHVFPGKGLFTSIGFTVFSAARPYWVRVIEL